MMQFGDDTEIHDLARENETLRAENERLSEQVRNRDYALDRVQVEVERLRVALRGALAMVEDFASGAGFSTSGRAEFEGYRRALEGK